MAKKNNNNTWMIAGGVALVAVLLYLVSSYSGLLGTKLYTGNNQAVATALECSWSADNMLEARLIVDGSPSNPAALESGSGLQAEIINWNVPESLGVATPSASITDEQGIARSKFKQAGGAAASSITATFAGDKIQIDARENADDAQVASVIVEYGPSSCEIPNANQ